MQSKSLSLQNLRQREMEEERRRIELAHQSLDNERNNKLAMKYMMQRERKEEIA